MKNKRLSNFDLMKIISMLFIILGHILMHGNVLSNTTGKTNVILTFIMIFIMVHVNSFVLVTGYFQYKKQFKLSKLISLNNSMWFYKVIIMLIFLGLGLITMSKIDIFKTLMPINYDDYWFISTYLLLYISTPLLNILINNLSKNQHKLTIIIMFLILAILPTITMQVAYNNNRGYSVANFIMLYFIGAYISKYDFKIFKEMDNKVVRVFCVLITLLMAAINLFIFGTINTIQNKGEILTYIYDIIENGKYSYCNPLIIIQTISYFYLFKTLNIKSKIITYISSLTFGVYLIHDNKIIRSYLYTNILKLPKTTIYTNRIIIQIIIYTILIFVVCAIIELIRKLIFKFIYNRKLSNKIRNRIKMKFKKCNINW